MDADKGAVALNILQRYVIFEVGRAFSLALLTMSAIFVLFMVAAQARDIGLTPQDIVELVPYVLPGTLPYTIPVSLLFAVTVVYGRLAGDNEIIAIKTAGVSVWTVLRPTYYMAIALSGILLFLSGSFIPRSTHLAKMVLFKDVEEMFYKWLKKDHEFNNPRWPFLIKVRDVRDKVMIYPTFKHRVPGKKDDFDMVIQAKEAVLHIDLDAKFVRVYFDDAEIMTRNDADVALIHDKPLEFPIPADSKFDVETKIQEKTNSQLVKEMAEQQYKIDTMRLRETIGAAFHFGTGRVERINWFDIRAAFVDHGYALRQYHELQTEWWQRMSMSFGSLMFVVLGAPVGIRFARRDFLSAFITCFVPIIIVYYPLMLFGVNMSKEGLMPPYYSLWMGNLILAMMAVLVLPPVIRH